MNLIYCELLKLKKTYIIRVLLIGGVFISILMDLISLVSSEKFQSFEHYSSNIDVLNILLLYTIFFSLIAGYVFFREFADKTASIIYTCSISRNKIFFSKLIVIYILIASVYMVKIVFIYLSCYIFGNAFPEVSFMVKHIEYNVYSLMFEFLLIPIPVLITNVSNNIILPTVYGILGTIITIITSGSSSTFTKYIPWLTPYKFIMKIYSPNLVNLNYSVITGVLCFIISIIICIYQYNNSDII